MRFLVQMPIVVLVPGVDAIVVSTQVYGMRNKNDNFPVNLGDGTYDLEGRPIQTFAIE